MSAVISRAVLCSCLPAAARLVLVATVFFGLVPDTATGAPLYDTPVYEPDTGSYFELRKVTPGYSVRGGAPAIQWPKAQVLARQSTYKGIRGRLAVVKSKEVNDFLRRTFKPDWGAWIGLRYWCKFNRLQWITGEFHERTAYANWDPVWNHEGSPGAARGQPSCRRKDTFWPVHYWSVDAGFRWNANGDQKEMRYFFIEYPTGKR